MQPPALLAWGRNDQFFPPAGAQAYLEDLPQAELHLLDVPGWLPRDAACTRGTRPDG
jgi:pimeloyl-ACP methyl ester carboxylesterase